MKKIFKTIKLFLLWKIVWTHKQSKWAPFETYYLLEYRNRWKNHSYSFYVTVAEGKYAKRMTELNKFEHVESNEKARKVITAPRKNGADRKVKILPIPRADFRGVTHSLKSPNGELECVYIDPKWTRNNIKGT